MSPTACGWALCRMWKFCCRRKVLALVVPVHCRAFGLFGRKDDFVIPWNCIRRIGSDIILVELEPDKCRDAPAQAGLVLKEAAGGAWMINRPGFGRASTGARRPGKTHGAYGTKAAPMSTKITASRLQRLAVIRFVPVASWGVPRDRGGAFAKFLPAGFFLVSRTWRACAPRSGQRVRR